MRIGFSCYVAKNTPSSRGSAGSSGFNRGGGLPFPWERGPAEQPGGMGITPSPFSATPSWKEGERRGRGGLWFAALVALFIATPSFATPTELDKKTVASKAYVDTKQDIIETGLVSLGDEWFEDLPSVVSFDSTSGLVGNKYGILDVNGSMNYIEDGWNNYVGDSEVEYLIPTVGAVGRELQFIWDIMPNWAPLTWNNTQSTAINAYNSTFTSNGANNTWKGTSTHLIDG